MAFRGNESPMDFAWQTNRPVDPTSPFVMASSKKRKTDPKSIFSNLPDLTADKGPQTAFDSPNRNGFALNHKPSLFSSSPKPMPSPYKDPSFTTPRKPYDLDFSSGPESSPVAPTDNDDTPDGKPLPSIPQPKAKKRNSLFNFYGKWAPSASANKSGKGEIAKAKSSKQDADSKRVHKRRRQAQSFEKQLARARKESEAEDSEPDSRSSSKRTRKQAPTHEIGFMTTLFTFIHTYPDAPSIIAKYLQVFFNAAILGSVLFMLYSFYATIRADIDKASADAYNEILADMSACTKDYIENKCGSSTRLPALEQLCSHWELCMNRDPNAVKRARLSAHTFAEIFNSFVEPISLKTMVFTTLVVGVALVINNATFTIYRRSQERHHEGFRQPSGQYGMHPGPHAAQMGQFAMTPALPYQTPGHYGWPTQGQELEGQRQLEYSESPTRDRGKVGVQKRKGRWAIDL